MHMVSVFTHKLFDLTLDTTYLEFVPRPETQSVLIPGRGRSVDNSLEKTSCTELVRILNMTQPLDLKTPS